MLSIFRNSDVQQLAEVQKKVEVQMQEIVSPVEVGVEEEIVSPTQRIIDELIELSEFETAREKKKTMRIIADLQELMEFE